MSYFSPETRVLSIWRRAGFFLKEELFRGQQTGRPLDQCDLLLCLDLTELASRSSLSC